MKGIYLASFKAEHLGHDIVYQDINGERDIGGDMMEVDLTPYDYVIATPPCNYWSRANYRRETSVYAQKTKHLLPAIIDKLIALKKPFIVENVRNSKRFMDYGLFNKSCFIIEFGRHTYWTNVMIDFTGIEQHFDFKIHGKWIGVQDIPQNTRQGGFNVHEVIEYWINYIERGQEICQ